GDEGVSRYGRLGDDRWLGIVYKNAADGPGPQKSESRVRRWFAGRTGLRRQRNRASAPGSANLFVGIHIRRENRRQGGSQQGRASGEQDGSCAGDESQSGKVGAAAQGLGIHRRACGVLETSVIQEIPGTGR